MRLLLFIPVLMLFLSNVPLIEEIPLENAMSMMYENASCNQQNKCGSSDEELRLDCSREETGCDPASEYSANHHCTAKNNCCQKTETTCICISCFQFAASMQPIVEFQFYCFKPHGPNSLFLPGHVKDQHVGAPWQPPDMA